MSDTTNDDILKRALAQLPVDAPYQVKQQAAVFLMKREDLAREASVDPVVDESAQTPNQMASSEGNPFSNVLMHNRELTKQIEDQAEEEIRVAQMIRSSWKTNLTKVFNKRVVAEIEALPRPYSTAPFRLTLLGIALGAGYGFYKDQTLEKAAKGAAVGALGGFASGMVLQLSFDECPAVSADLRMPSEIEAALLKSNPRMTSKVWTVVHEVWAELATEFNRLNPGPMAKVSAAAVAAQQFSGALKR